MFTTHVEYEGVVYTLKQVEQDDCVVLLGEEPVDDATAANVYMTAFLSLIRIWRIPVSDATTFRGLKHLRKA